MPLPARLVTLAIACASCGRVGFDAEVRDGEMACIADTMIDPMNCGTCGHDCLGGDCVLGRCQPVEIANGQGSPRGIVVDATHVYWTAAGAIRRAAKTDRLVEEVTTYSGHAFRMISFDAHLYWVTRDTGLVARTRLVSPHLTEILATGQGDVGGVATDGTTVYYDTYPTGGLIYRVAVAGGPPSTVLAVPTDNLTGMRRVGSTLYYIELGAGLLSIPVGGGAPTLVTPSVGSWEFAIDGTEVFIADKQPGTAVVRTDLMGAAPVVLGEADDPWGIVVDATHVYYANENGDTIARAPRDGSGPTEILATAMRPVGIAVDDDAIYWTTYGGGVYLVAK